MLVFIAWYCQEALLNKHGSTVARIQRSGLLLRYPPVGHHVPQEISKDCGSQNDWCGKTGGRSTTHRRDRGQSGSGFSETPKMPADPVSQSAGQRSTLHRRQQNVPTTANPYSVRDNKPTAPSQPAPDTQRRAEYPAPYYPIEACLPETVFAGR